VDLSGLFLSMIYSSVSFIFLFFKNRYENSKRIYKRKIEHIESGKKGYVVVF